MASQGRWKASVNSDGELEDVQWDPLAEEDVTGTKETTYGTHYQAWAQTKEQAIEDALEYYRRAQS